MWAEKLMNNLKTGYSRASLRKVLLNRKNENDNATTPADNLFVQAGTFNVPARQPSGCLCDCPIGKALVRK